MANWLLLNLLLLLLLVGISRSQTGIGSEDVKPEPQPPTVPETGTGGDSVLETFPSPQLPSEKAQSQGDEDAAWPIPQSDNEIDTGFDNQDEANSNIDPSNDVNNADEDTDEENDEGPTDDEKPVADGTLQPTTMKSLNQDDGLPSNPEITLPSDAPVSDALNETRDSLVALAKKIPLNLAPEQMDQWRQNISDRFGLSPLETAKVMLPLGYDRDSTADNADSPVVQSQNSPGLQQNDQAEQPQNTEMENAQKSLLPFRQKGDSAPFQSQTNPGLLQNSQSLLPQLPFDLEENNENIPGDQGKDASHENTVKNADIGNPPSASDSDDESPGDGTPTYDTNETDEDYEVGDDNYKVDEKGKDARTDGMGFNEDKGYKGEDSEEDNYKDADVGKAAEFDSRFKGNDREYGVNENEASEGGAGKPDTTYEENNDPEEIINNYKPSLTQQDKNENEKSDSINQNNNEKGGDDDGTDSEADDDFADDQDDDYQYDDDDYEYQKHDKSNGKAKNQVEDNKQNIGIGENDNIQNDGDLEIADKPPQDTVPERYGKKESDEDDYKFDHDEMPWMNKPGDDGAKDDWYYNPGAGDTALKSTTAGNTLASALLPELPNEQKVNKTKGASTQIAAPSEYIEGVISVEEARSRKPLQAPKGTIILYTVLIVCFIAGIVIFSIWKNPFKVSRPASHATPVIRTGEEGKRLLDHPFV